MNKVFDLNKFRFYKKINCNDIYCLELKTNISYIFNKQGS